MTFVNTHKVNGNPGYGKVAVLMGGNTSEREISLESGMAVLKALMRLGINAQPVDTRETGFIELFNGKYDRAFIALHGRGGEDGVIQGALETAGIPYTGSRVLGSALAMDKIRSKLIWRSLGMMTPDFVEIRNKSELQRIAAELGFPVMIKPVHEGSSCGAARVTSEQGLEMAWDNARALDSSVLVEQWIDGVEYTASILGGEVLPLIRLETPREFYDYEAKYKSDSTQYICPCELKPDQERELAALMLAAFNALGASGWGRVDFIVDKEGIAWLIEVNTVPGMTSHSLVPMSALQAGIDFDNLVLQILDTSKLEYCQ